MTDTNENACSNFRHAALIADRAEKARDNKSGNGQWGYRHWLAFNNPRRSTEVSIVNLMKATALHADNHREAYGSGIGEDGVLGDHWADIVRGIRGLLNGDCGRLDCGTLDGTLCDMLAAEGFDRE
jgi:hypothetical protein